MHIDFIFDTVCPWSFIAKRNLDAALRHYPDIPFDIGLFPFPLCNTLLFPQPSYATTALMVKRTVEMKEKLMPSATQAGITIQFDNLPVVTEPSLSYVFIRSAAAFGRGLEALDAVFTAFFCHGKDIGNPDVLCDISERLSTDRPAVKNVSSTLHLPSLDGFPDWTERFSVKATPSFVFDGKTMISGALPSEILNKMIETAIALEKDDF